MIVQLVLVFCLCRFDTVYCDIEGLQLVPVSPSVVIQ